MIISLLRKKSKFFQVSDYFLMTFDVFLFHIRSIFFTHLVLFNTNAYAFFSLVHFSPNASHSFHML